MGIIPTTASSAALSLNIRILFTAANDNKVGIKYDESRFTVMYRGIPLGRGTVPGFYKSAHSVRQVETTIVVDRVSLLQADAADLLRDASSNDRVELRVAGAKIWIPGFTWPSVQMESNDKELESAAGSVPTRGSAAKASATQQDNVEGDDGDDEVECEDTADEKRKRKLRSRVWEHSKKEKIGREWKAICNHCKKQLGGKSKNGTTHLWDHLKICPHKKRKDIKQCLLNPKDQVMGPQNLVHINSTKSMQGASLGK